MQETRNCQNCKKDFTIEPEDFSFYEKIKVPPPTFCFDCRMQRRMMFRNERVLYKRKNNAPDHEGEDIISIYNPESTVNVYDDRTWWSDSWDPFDFGFPYDFSKPFFEQFKTLYNTTPLIALSVTNLSNCSFCNVSEGDKGSYMLSGSEHNEDCLYGNRVVENRQSADLYVAFENELCYDVTNCTKCYRTFYSVNAQECADAYFLLNCKNCTDCIGCINLRNRSHCIFNEQCSKEEYEKKKKELALDTFVGVKNCRKEFQTFTLTQFFKYANNLKADGCTGDNLVGATRAYNTFDFQTVEDLKHCVWGMRIKNSYDAGPGIGDSEGPLYEVLDVMEGSDLFFSGVIYSSLDVSYSINCHGGEHLFGCYGLRNKKYCIFNRQYSKEEYETLIPKIIAHMNEMPYIDSKGRKFTYGEFFPYDLSPFAYNETIAQEYFPLTKKEVEQHGWKWYERPDRDYVSTIKEFEIPELNEATNSILGEVVECANKGLETSACTTAFRIIQAELELYRKLNVPLPHFCYNCRHYNRLALRNPLKLWHRSCMCDLEGHNHARKCPNEFETSYAPERPEKIFCESCYQKEVI